MLETLVCLEAMKVEFSLFLLLFIDKTIAYVRIGRFLLDTEAVHEGPW